MKTLLTFALATLMFASCNLPKEQYAAKILVKNGFKVIELDAGYNDWLAKGMPEQSKFITEYIAKDII